MTEQLHLFALPRPLRFGDVRCVDCEADTFALDEVYIVHSDLWPLRPHGGMLCIGCLEERIGRRLAPDDFADVPLNGFGGHSAQLRARLGGRRFPPLPREPW